MRQWQSTLLIIGLLYLGGCEPKNSAPPESPRIKNSKFAKIILPEINQSAKLGKAVSFQLESVQGSIDSVLIQADGSSQVYNASSFKWVPTTQKTGTCKIQVTVYGNGKEEIHYPRLKLLSDIEPEQFSYVVIAAHPHDTNDYTQGLFFLDSQLIESTGQTEKSEIKKVDPISGEVIVKVPLDDQYFGEGSTRYGNEIYQLTWKLRTGFVYDLDLNKKRSFQYNTQGWGLTTKGDSLAMSDGTEKIYFMNPSDFKEVGRIEVYNDKGAVDSLNELEYINGQIYANEYQTDLIHAIEPSTGRILKTIDLSGLLTSEEAAAAHELNGIAYDQQGDRLFVTGKWWPWLFEIKLRPKSANL